MIAIIDYGMGNIHSVNKGLQSFGASTIVTDDQEEIKKSRKIVLPGVGAFEDAVLELKKQGLFNLLIDQIKIGKPFLGICLGMQILFQNSEEGGKISQGLGIFKGKVKRFKGGDNFKVPHMGWNQLKIKEKASSLLSQIPDGSYVYFCHSYYPQTIDDDDIIATTDYELEFSSAVCKNNVYGVQFHPEKSQRVGLKILENFLKLC